MSRINEIMNNTVEAEEVLNQLEDLAMEIESLLNVIKAEREGFDCLEKAVEEHQDAAKIFKRYSELRVKP